MLKAVGCLFIGFPIEGQNGNFNIFGFI